MKITYTQYGDYYLPDLELPSEGREIGVWGLRHKRYIEAHRPGFFSSLVLSGKLDDYLADIDEQVESLLPRMVKEMAAQEGITERLKEEKQMEWVRRMNNIRNRAEEIIYDKIIYT